MRTRPSAPQPCPPIPPLRRPRSTAHTRPPRPLNNYSAEQQWHSTPFYRDASPQRRATAGAALLAARRIDAIAFPRPLDAWLRCRPCRGHAHPSLYRDAPAATFPSAALPAATPPRSLPQRPTSHDVAATIRPLGKPDRTEMLETLRIPKIAGTTDYEPYSNPRWHHTVFEEAAADGEWLLE